MQHVDGVADVKALAQPSRGRGVRVHHEPFRFVPRSDRLQGIAGHAGRRWDVGDHAAVGTPELQLAVRLALDLVTLLVDGAVVPATEQRQVRERRRAALGPVTDVMALAEPNATAGETTATVAVVEGSP